ncbi:class II glutamine amidotransferase, partial [Aeromonas hydrophila]|uniref:class II glutamine amidotransferase n=1 Tax=Aeromonas hydrophila TaxID=644 RepID=UPI000D42C59F
ARLLDEDVAIDFQSETTPNDVVTLLATRPLTGNENWVKMVPGEFCLFRLGELEYGNAANLLNQK